MPTLLQHVESLRNGCPHRAEDGDTGICIPCRHELASKLEVVFALMDRRAGLMSEIAALTSRLESWRVF